MNRIFEPRGYFRVPDGTSVSPFLNATDSTREDLPWGLLGDLSIASGLIGAKVHSRVHAHPVVTVVTFLVAGQLMIRMKEEASPEPYDLLLMKPGQAVLAQPGTITQLRNDFEQEAWVLYIVSPSYIFEMDDEKVRYDDAMVVAQTWEELQASHYDPPALRVSRNEASVRRQESMYRLRQHRESGSTDPTRAPIVD